MTNQEFDAVGKHLSFLGQPAVKPGLAEARREIGAANRLYLAGNFPSARAHAQRALEIGQAARKSAAATEVIEKAQRVYAKAQDENKGGK